MIVETPEGRLVRFTQDRALLDDIAMKRAVLEMEDRAPDDSQVVIGSVENKSGQAGHRK